MHISEYTKRGVGTYIMSLCRYCERSFVQMKSNNVNKSLFGLNLYALYYYV